jgi:G3E family GTPase
MTKIDIFSGFLGAGKTTLIKKLLREAYAGEKVVLIENEFGQIGIDSGFLKECGVQITEMNQGCICCSLVGDFAKALAQVLTDFTPDRILIEPSGVGKLSDVMRAVEGVLSDDVVLNSYTTVVDANKCKLYMKNFGEFFNDQIEHARCIVLSHTDHIAQDKLAACLALLREHNEGATIVTTPWSTLDGKQLTAAMEHSHTLETELARMEHDIKHHHHDGECNDPDCCCHHHHDEHEHEHHHEHHHHHDGECDDPDCCCHHHHDEHKHHHHHHADDVFTSWGAETARQYTADDIRATLDALDETTYGTVLRAKGIVPATDGTWIHFDYVPGEPDIRTGAADVTGRLCVIGAGLDKAAIAALFGIN